MTAIADIVLADLLEVFGERDAGRRRAAVARLCADDVEFADAEGTLTGHDALVAKAQQILDGAPGFVFTPVGDVRVVQDLGYLAWAFGPEGAPPVVTGADIVLVRDGLITSIHTLLDGGA